MTRLANRMWIGALLGPLLPVVAAAASLAAPPAVVPAEENAETYAYCLKLAKLDAGAAIRLAGEWRARGGAHPADHCAAVALVEQGRYRDGAAKLETLAQAMRQAPPQLRAGVYDQAGQAWLLAGDPAHAYKTAGAAIALQPSDPELRIDRAEAAASAHYFDRAVADLDVVLAADPNRVDALVYRASAYRALDRLAPALADIDRALAGNPDSVPALLERGNIRALAGDPDGARRDWQRIAALAPGSKAEAAARSNLEHLASGKEPAAAGGAPR